MAKEGVAGAERPAHQLRKQQDHPVALAEAIEVIERLEIIQIEVDQRRRCLRLQRARDPIDDRRVAGKPAQRVLIARLGQALLLDQAQQGSGVQHADIAVAVDHDHIPPDRPPAVKVARMPSTGVSISQIGQRLTKSMSRLPLALFGQEIPAVARIDEVLEVVLADDAERPPAGVGDGKEASVLVAAKHLEHVRHDRIDPDRRDGRDLLAHQGAVAAGVPPVAPVDLQPP